MGEYGFGGGRRVRLPPALKRGAAAHVSTRAISLGEVHVESKC